MDRLDTEFEFVRRERYKIAVEPIAGQDCYGLAKVSKVPAKKSETYLVDDVSLARFRKSGNTRDLPARIAIDASFAVRSAPVYVVFMKRASAEKLQRTGMHSSLDPYARFIRETEVAGGTDLVPMGFRAYDHAIFMTDGTPLTVFSFLDEVSDYNLDAERVLAFLEERRKSHGDVEPLDRNGEPAEAFQRTYGKVPFSMRFATPQDAGFSTGSGVSPRTAFMKAYEILDLARFGKPDEPEDEDGYSPSW